MTDSDTGMTERDFFVSYQQADRLWAEWIAWQLEYAGHSVLFQLWDFVPGTNWIKLMQDGVSGSARVIVVLSPAYIGSVFGAAEWQAVWVHDPDGAKRRVIPVRVADCERPGLLAGLVGIDLFGVPEPKAVQRFQDAIQRSIAGRAKPLRQPSFPAPQPVPPIRELHLALASGEHLYRAPPHQLRMRAVPGSGPHKSGRGPRRSGCAD